MDIRTDIKKAAASLGLDACGICGREEYGALRKRLENEGPFPFVPAAAEDRLSWDALLPGARSAAVVLFPYRPAEEEKGNIALYARPRDYHAVNRRRLDALAGRLREAYPDAGFRAVTDTSPLADRWLAWCAGLGFFGKNHCLIHPRYGSLFTIGALLTTLSAAPDRPMEDSCGSCRRCIDACPGRALSETSMDPWRCKSYLTQKKEALTDEEKAILRRTPLIFGCDECQRCCPRNENAAPSPLPEIREDRIPLLTKETLASLSNRAFEKRFRGYAFAWRGKKILERNLDILEGSPRTENSPET